ncbi:hypothetical protein XENOCAPTIV_026824 [Xenoophorus captivus]|uniref:Uncharacterized protein n=1 Tax=Xenoophorus captivus TaxID=1517983 RepID=A0ABV0R396_9TELE
MPGLIPILSNYVTSVPKEFVSHQSVIFYRLFHSGSWGSWCLSPAVYGQEAGTPWTGRQSIAGQHTNTHTPKDNLESPINLTGMSLDCGRKPEYLVRTHTYTGRTCKLHAERPPTGN